MKYRVEFFKDDKCFHFKEWDLGLDTAKQHAIGMLKPYGASFSRIVDDKGRKVFSHPAVPVPGVLDGAV